MADRPDISGDGGDIGIRQRRCRRGPPGGTGIHFYNGGLYAEQNDKIVRYPLEGNAIVPAEAPQVIISGLPLTGDHPMHPFIIDADGHLYVDLGSATNSCQIAPPFGGIGTE